MFLTSLTPKHMYSYISENKFGIFYHNNCFHRLYFPTAFSAGHFKIRFALYMHHTNSQTNLHDPPL